MKKDPVPTIEGPTSSARYADESWTEEAGILQMNDGDYQSHIWDMSQHNERDRCDRKTFK